MINDTERREVARRLREYSGGRKAFHLGRLCAACGIDKSRLMSRTTDADAEAWAHLADLIEPSESGQNLDRNQDTVQMESPAVQIEHECDRDALLALADEMEEFGNLPIKNPGIRVLQNDDFSRELGYARRIREALGVSE